MILLWVSFLRNLQENKQFIDTFQFSRSMAVHFYNQKCLKTLQKIQFSFFLNTFKTQMELLKEFKISKSNSINY